MKGQPKIREGIAFQGQTYVDTAIKETIHPTTIAVALAKAFNYRRPPTMTRTVGYEREYLKWVEPDNSRGGRT